MTTVTYKCSDKLAHEDRTQLNASIPVRFHTALKVKAATEGTTIAKLIEDWISSWAKM